MEFKPPFETWVKRRRIELDLSRPMLARKMGYAAETLRKMESGRLKPSAQMAALLAKHLAIPEAQRDDFYAFASNHLNHNGSRDAAGHLPLFVTPLLGREAGLAAVMQLLERDEVRLVTLAGPPGVGKTRLAVEVARQMRDHFTDGTPFADLAATTDPGAALSVIAQSLGVSAAQNVSALKALQESLRNRQALLVLDNLEQVLALGPLLAHVLSAAPRVKVLTTSREVLNISIEQAYALAPLENRNTHAGDWHSPAVELFAQRARLVKPAFALDEVSGPIVAAICQKLDGLPLAIELAAARMAIFTPAEILTRLEKRLPVLAAGARDLPDCQRTLNATLDWSYALLSKDEQALFRQLGVFAGGFTLHTAELFCDVEGLALDVEEGLTALAAKHLIHRIDTANGESRYVILETIRAYALDQLSRHGELDDWHEHLADYLISFRVQSGIRHVYQADADNWRASLSWAMTAGRLEDIGMPLLKSAHGFGISRRERIAWLGRVLAQPYIDLYPISHARALAMLGEAMLYVGNSPQGLQFLERCAEVCRKNNLHVELTETLFLQGMTWRNKGDVPHARSALLECIDCCRRWGFDERIPHMQITLASIETLDEHGTLALQLVEQALEGGAGDSPFLSAWAANKKAHALHLLGDLAGAQAQAQHSLDLFRRLGAQEGVETFWNYAALAEIVLARQDVPAVMQNAQRCLEVGYSDDDLSTLAWCIAALAGACALDHQPEQGARLWGIGESLCTNFQLHAAPASRPNRERTVSLLREQLGDGEFVRLAGEGAKMSVDEAVAFALEENRV